MHSSEPSEDPSNPVRTESRKRRARASRRTVASDRHSLGVVAEQLNFLELGSYYSLVLPIKPLQLKLFH